MITFNDLLSKAEIDPKTVLIMRHRPTEQGLRKVLPWFAVDQPEVFNAYQQTQGGINAEKALMRAEFLAAFLGETPGLAHFVGIYRRGDYRKISNEEYWAIPEYKQLLQAGLSSAAVRHDMLLFNLELTEIFADLQGKLVLTWTGLERSWYRWADRNRFPLHAILEESAFAKAMPVWQELILSWTELQSLPASWAQTLAEWRGIYLICDATDGRSYVGSAYGSDNIMGRWLSYATTGHGGNKELRNRNPGKFSFSVLQRVSPDMEPTDVISIEATWKDRLHTREFGLNSN